MVCDIDPSIHKRLEKSGKGAISRKVWERPPNLNGILTCDIPGESVYTGFPKPAYGRSSTAYGKLSTAYGTSSISAVDQNND